MSDHLNVTSSRPNELTLGWCKGCVLCRSSGTRGCKSSSISREAQCHGLWTLLSAEGSVHEGFRSSWLLRLKVSAVVVGLLGSLVERYAGIFLFSFSPMWEHWGWRIPFDSKVMRGEMCSNGSCSGGVKQYRFWAGLLGGVSVGEDDAVLHLFFSHGRGCSWGYVNAELVNGCWM